MYIETVARVARTYRTPQNSGGPNDVWTWSTLPAPTGGTYALEMDVFELYEDTGGFGNASFCSHNTGACDFNWTSYGTNNLPAGWKPTDYHKYGMLLTSDGATEIYRCSFVDDIFQGCQAARAASAPGLSCPATGSLPARAATPPPRPPTLTCISSTSTSIPARTGRPRCATGRHCSTAVGSPTGTCENDHRAEASSDHCQRARSRSRNVAWCSE